MAALTVSDNLWPFVDSFVLGNGVVSQVILPGVPYTMRVSMRPRTTAGKFIGANKALADGDSLGATNYATMDADQWSSFLVHPKPGATQSFCVAGTNAGVVEIWVGPAAASTGGA